MNTLAEVMLWLADVGGRITFDEFRHANRPKLITVTIIACGRALSTTISEKQLHYEGDNKGRFVSSIIVETAVALQHAISTMAPEGGVKP